MPLLLRAFSRSFLLILITLLALATPAVNQAATTTQSSTETALSNGMRVIVKRDARAPVVVCMVWYKVGSV
ncbi:MAG: hypothetical protein ACXW20_20980, partial [Burkholderiales bacterium]